MSAPRTRYVALFRGINVGKAKRIAMADLRALLNRLGYSDVRTLLNSGNAIFTAQGDPAALALRIRAEVARQLGVDALVIVKSAADIVAIHRGNALESIVTDPSRLLVAMANEPGVIAGLRKHIPEMRGEERVHVNRHAAYLWCAHGILESQAVEVLLGLLKDRGTTRNWGTLARIHALMAE